MHLSLARKYRPKTFASVAVQTHVSNTLRGAIARGRVAHGYLLCGPRGVGKTTLARVLAMALNCERRGEAPAGDGEPCGECASCQRIWGGSASLDVVEIDAASNRGVDDARELRERAMYAPSTSDHYKVYIVDEAHMLTREAWNALLKILEEPPPRVVFVFATTEPQKIAQSAAPVLSRLQRFDLKRIGQSEIRARLSAVLAAEGVEADSDAVDMIARAADGSMRDALSLADQVLSLGGDRVSPSRVRDALGLVAEDEYLAMLDLIAERRAGDIFGAVQRLADAGVDLGAFLSGLADALRDLLALTLGGAPAGLSEAMRAGLAARRDRLTAADLLRMLSAIAELEAQFRRSGQQQLLLETLLVRFALLDRSVSLEEVLRELDRSGGVELDAGRTGATPETHGGPRADRADRGREASAVQVGREPPSTEPSGRAVAPARTARPVGAAAAVAPSAPTVAAPDAHATAERRAPTGGPPPVELNRLAERWGDVIAALRADNRPLVAAAAEHAIPVAVSARGDVTLELDAPNEVYARGIESAAPEVLAEIGTLFSGATRLIVRAPNRAPPADTPKRLTEEAVRTERLALLRSRDPTLDAAVDALDLELLD